MNGQCDHCGCKMRKHTFKNARWDYPDKDWLWLCSNIVCITERYSACELFDHEKTINDKGKTVCNKCGKSMEDEE